MAEISKELINMELAIIGLCLLILFALALVYHKLSKILSIARDDILANSNNAITQFEGLLFLYTEIKSGRGIPKSRGWAGSPDLLALVGRLIQDTNARVVVECSSGLSTLVVAACLRNQGAGQVISLEHDPHYAAKTNELLKLHGLDEWATVVHAPLKPLDTGTWRGQWYDTSALPEDLSIDLLLVDGPPMNTGKLARYPALPQLRRLMKAGSMVVLDDAERADEREAIVRWLSENTELQKIEAGRVDKGYVVLKFGSRQE